MASQPSEHIEEQIDGQIEAPTESSAPRRSNLPYSFAKRHGVLIDGYDDDIPTLVHRPKVSNASLLEARRIAGRPVTSQSVSEDEFDLMLTRTYEGDTGDAMNIMDDFGDELDLDRMAESLEPEDLMESQDDAPVIKLINAMLTEAIRKGASDIHIEPFEKRLSVRYRVDGVMNKLLEPPQQAAAQVISRIKVMAKLDIAEKRLPQDGRISLRVAGRPVDVRVSTLPSGHGERVVLRLLDKQAGRLDLEHLGMSDESRENLETVLKMPHGIILVTGPTGSGKTTSLYAALTRLNNSRTTILTVEDPIEYYLDGIGQTQVNTKVELTFARGLRAILVLSHACAIWVWNRFYCHPAWLVWWRSAWCASCVTTARLLMIQVSPSAKHSASWIRLRRRFICHMVAPSVTTAATSVAPVFTKWHWSMNRCAT